MPLTASKQLEEVALKNYLLTTHTTRCPDGLHVAVGLDAAPAEEERDPRLEGRVTNVNANGRRACERFSDPTLRKLVISLAWRIESGVRAARSSMNSFVGTLCVFGSLLTPITHAQRPRIFFGTVDTITGRDMHRPDPLAYMNFFTPDAPWQRGASRVDVFQVSTQFLLSSTDEQLDTVFSDMKRRGIPVGVSMGAVEREPGCGGGEGYLPANVVDTVGKRLTRRGFRLEVMEMDEPIWFAHEVSWGKQLDHSPCHYPLPKLVQQVALTIKHLRQYFPEIQVGDIEVIADYADRQELKIDAVVKDYVLFSRLFRQATGTKLAFFHSDIAWRTNWHPAYLLAAKSFRAEGIRFGAVIGGRPVDPTDVAFEQFGLDQLKSFQSNPATRLDDILIESWQPRPTKFLPETEPGTSTNLLLRSEALAIH